MLLSRLRHVAQSTQYSLLYLSEEINSSTFNLGFPDGDVTTSPTRPHFVSRTTTTGAQRGAEDQLQLCPSCVDETTTAVAVNGAFNDPKYVVTKYGRQTTYKKTNKPGKPKNTKMSVNLSDDQFDRLIKSLNNRRGTLASCRTSYDGTKNSETVEAFLAAVRVFKKVEGISDADALDGVPLLLHDEAAIWWQGMKETVSSWEQFEEHLRANFAPKKPEYLIYHEIISERQAKPQDTATFIAKKRMLFSQLPKAEHLKEKQQLDLIYSLLNLTIRDKVPRGSITSFEDLLRNAQGVEQVLQEKGDPIPIITKKKSAFNKIRCNYCKNIGHDIEQCRKRKSSEADSAKMRPSEATTSTARDSAPINKLACYGCGAPGVYRSNCTTCGGKKPETDTKLSFCSVKVAKVDTHARPTVFVKIDGMNGTAFIDTCAKASVASYQLYQILLARGQTFNKQNVNITLADGVPRCEQVLTFDVDVELCGRKIRTNFIVMPNSKDNRTLLGIGFLKQAGIVLNLAQFTWSFIDNPEKGYELYSEDFITFPNSPPKVINLAPISPTPIEHQVVTGLSSSTGPVHLHNPMTPPEEEFMEYKLIPLDIPETHEE